MSTETFSAVMWGGEVEAGKEEGELLISAMAHTKKPGPLRHHASCHHGQSYM